MRIVKSVRFCFQWLPLRPDTCHDFRNTHRHKVLGTIQRPSPRPIQSARPGVPPPSEHSCLNRAPTVDIKNSTPTSKLQQ